MKFEIPTKDSKKWIQANKGDIFGNLWATFNMDFDASPGKVRVAPRLRINTDSVDNAVLGASWAFIRTLADGTDRWWAGCGGVLFKTAGTNPTTAFTQDNITGGAGTDDDSPDDLSVIISDMVEFNGWLVVSRSTNLARLVSGTWKRTWWTDTVVNGGLAQALLTTSIAHPIHTSLKTNLLLIGDGNLLHTVDKYSNVKNSRVILPTEFEITWIYSNYDGTWIGARNKFNREGNVFFWDEYSENYNRKYGVKSDISFACIIKDGIPYIVNGEGQLLKFNGSGFEEVAVFPVFRQVNKRWNDAVAARQLIQKNGIAIIEDKIHILAFSRINDDSTKFMENFPSGIYIYDEKQGLRHKYALTLYDGTEIDYGCLSTIIYPGALVPTNQSQGLFLAGGLIPSDSMTFLYAIFYRDVDDSINKRGHFITSIFESSAFEDIFKDILLSFKRFRNSGDRIIIKYRAIKNPNYPIEGIGTWTSTTIFTTTQSLANASAGDEAMIIRGKGSGATTKISSITELAGTYTVTLAEAVTGVSGTLRFLIGDWTEVATISTQGIERQSFDLDVVGTFIQLKIELRSVPAGTTGAGDSPELEKIIINSSPESLI